MQCTAKSKQSGQQCKRQAVRGGTKCYMHGGGSLAGVASPSFKTGRYSKHLPARLAANYQAALADSRLLELRDEVALVDARLAELVGQLDSGESGRRWQALQAAHGAVKQAIRSRDSAALNKALAVLGNAIDAGVQDAQLWNEIVALTDQRRKLVESERKRLVEMQQMITSERAMVLLAAIVGIIRNHVSDTGTLAAISADLRQLTAVEPG